jgi:flagellar L-ring protein precursor FlgH
MPPYPKETDMYPRTCLLLACLLSSTPLMLAAKKKAPRTPPPSPLDQYVKQAMAGTVSAQTPTGSLWAPTSHFMNLGGDLRASQVNDILTIVVSEQASAVAQGTTKTQRQSTLNSSITAAGGPTKPTGALANLVNLNTQSALNGQGATTRSTTLNTTLTARVTQVLPNGYLVIEASKEVDVNSEHQLVTIRGVVRPVDLTTANTISSNQIADMELMIDGKGVINDAVRRPWVVWRVLMGILPF